MNANRNMHRYDVIIVGGGPAGLKCAHTLAGSGLRVLLAEKNGIFGDKVCAGGITRKDIALLGIPDSLIEHRISHTRLHSRRFLSSTSAPAPFMYMVSRRELGAWQRGQLEGTGIEVMENAKVTGIAEDHVTINGSEEFGFSYLVGADGYASLVRRHLGIPVGKRLIGLQYQVPYNDKPGINGDIPGRHFEMYLHSKYFHSWYAWIFPHRHTFAAGCIGDPEVLPPQKLKQNFRKWLEDLGIDLTGATYESCPISYDYRGFRFGNIFLAGEAAGLASGLTGEGIYQSLVSGEAVARTILNPDHISEPLQKVIRYNSVQYKVMKTLNYSGPLQGIIHDLIILALNNRWVKGRINKAFVG